MQIPFTEPTSPRYIYHNPLTNKVHVLLPVVSGSQIGLDNTCKSVYGLQEFFGKSRDVHQRAVLEEVKAYQKALEFDLSLIPGESKLKTKKQARLEQIIRYSTAIETVLSADVLNSLDKVFPEYPAPLQELMKKDSSNLHSMVLRPKEKDNFLRSVNPVFSLKREEGASVFYQTLSEAYQGVSASQDARARLTASVETSPEGRAMDFSGIQRVLREQTQRHLGVDIDYSLKAGEPITKASIDELMMFDEENPPSAKDYIDALLGISAPNLFDDLLESPFHTIKNPEGLSIVTQFFLASVNIYCRAHGLGSANFGQILDESEELSQTIAGFVLSLQQGGPRIEDVLLDFINEHRITFGLKNPLRPVDRGQMKKQFTEQFAEIKESPHFDEFTLLDSTKPGPFLIHQGSICLNFAEFVKAGFPALDPEFFATVRNDFKGRLNAITHNNPSVHASIELSLAELLEKIKDEDHLGAVLKKLPPEEQAAILASPQIKRLQLPKFFHQVAKGQQNEAEQLLKANPDVQLLLHHGEFTDYSGRTFNCTAYEYAYWAKDTHMCRMLERLMDEETKAHMLNRCEAIEAHGLTYTQHGQELISKHFDFTPLKAALQAYIQGYRDWERTENWDAMMAAWIVVGMAQRDVPAHVAQEYCRDDRVFSPLARFDDASLPRTLTYYNWSTERDESWFPLALPNSSGLGVDFALIHGGDGARGWDGWVDGYRQRGPATMLRDLGTVSRLDEERSADCTLSLEHLRPVVGDHALGMS
ncbi:MAG: hypothetical protein PSV35_04755 [bacterium]|nr:hypothetical protein [bacterium]